MSRPTNTLVLLLVCFLPLSIAQAQVNNSNINNAMQAGYPPYGTFSGSNFDQVSYQNGNLHISIPLVDIPQRNGKTYSYHFVYNLPSWMETATWEPNGDPVGFHWGVTLGSQFLNWGLASNVSGWTVQYQNNGIACPNNIQYGLIDGVRITDPEGTVHSVLMQLTDGAPSTCAQNIPAGLTTDGTGILVTGTWTGGAPTFTATLKDGTKIPVLSTQTWKDNNGNEMSPTADMLERDPLTAYNAPNKSYTTPLGNPATGPAYTTWTYRDSNGASQSFTLNYEAIDIQTSFAIVPGGTTLQYSCACVVPSSLSLPDSGGVYTFGWKNNDTGELQSVGLPTGGSISYTYGVGTAIFTLPNSFNVNTCTNQGQDCTEVQTIREQVTSRTVTDNTGTHVWNYTWASGYQGGGTVTDPLGNKEVHTYAYVGTCATGGGCTSYETEVQYENSAGTVLRTVAKAYAYDTISGGPGFTNGGLGNVRLTSETTTLNDVTPNQVKQVNTTYEVISSNYIAPGTSYNTSWLNPSSVSESDWGSGSPGPILRYTTYTYLHDPGNTGGYTNYLSRNIADRVLVKTVYDSTGNTCQGVSQPCAQTTNEYDNYSHTGQPMQSSGAVQHDSTNYSTTFAYRGNLTAVSQWLNTTGSLLTTTNQYDDAGGLLSVIDPNLNKTTFSRSDSWSNTTCAPSGQGKAYITSITNALSQTTTNKYDSCTGLRASTTDANTPGNITSFTYDFADRLTLTKLPDGGQASTTYNDNPPVSATTTETISAGAPSKITTTVRDDLGRVSRTQLSSDPQGTDYTLTTYDALGRVSQVYNPTRCNPPGTNCGEGTWGYSTTSYDPLSRVISVVEQDGSTISTSYTGRATEVSDEGNGTRSVQRISQVDGLGRLKSVCEVTSNTVLGITPTPAACGLDIAATGFLTSYSYDALGDLTSVAQGGLNGRSFGYDSLSRLTTAQNPESGKITYAYDGDSNLSQRSAPKPNQTGSATVTTTYGYDALNRITSKTYSDGTPSVGYYYDQASPWGLGQYEHNYIGRLTQTGVFLNGNTLAGSVNSYDAMGRIANQWQCTPLDCGTTATYFAFTYDLLGNLTTSSNNTDNITYTNSYDAAARLTQVQSSPSYTQNPLITFSSFSAIQKPGQIAYGNGITDTLEYDKRQRLYALNEVGLYAYNIQNGSAAGFAPNGNILYSNDSANGNWAYTYDDFNRLVSGTCSANCPAAAGFTYAYDRFGNRLKETVTAGTGVSPQYSFNPNNQIDVSGVTYDAAGNVMNDGLGNSYFYDAENRIIQVNGTLGQCSTATACYVYDAFGHRVRATVNAQTRDFVYDLGGRTIDQITAGSLTRSEAYAGGQHVATYANSTAEFDNSDWLSTFRVRSDVSGNKIESCTSLPFGEDLTCVGPEVSPIHFTGKEHDSETGDDFFGARYYGSTMGRFLTPDWAAKPVNVPYAHFGNPQSLNLYSYVQNNPTTVGDPDGHCNTGCTIVQSNGYGEGASVPPDNPAEFSQSAIFLSLAGDQAQNTNDPTAPPTPPTPDPAGTRTDPALNPTSSAPSTTSSPADQTQAPMESRGQGGKGERGQTSKPDNPTKGAQPIRDKDGKITGWRLPTPDGKGVKKGLDWGRVNGLDPAKFQTAAKIGVIGAIGAAGAYAISTAPEWGPFLLLVP